jgi:hypothetical protein
MGNVRITKDTLIKTLQAEVPSFVIDPDWIEEALSYPIINDFARYICQEADIAFYIHEADSYDEVKKALRFLEMGLEAQDPYMRDLVHECLETLLSCNRIPEIKVYFGPRVLRFWNEFFEKYSE